MTDTDERVDPRRRAWDSHRPPRRLQALWVALALLFGLPALVLTALRVFPPRSDGPALVASFIAYAVVAYGVALVALLIVWVRARRRTMVGVVTLLTAGLLAAHVYWLAPMFIPDPQATSRAGFTLLSLNMHAGQADLDQLVAQARRADVVILVESTPEALAGLERFDWDAQFPYVLGGRDDYATNTTIYSRFPLSHNAAVPHSSFQQWVTSVSVPDMGSVRLLAVHPCNPYCGKGLWASEHDELAAIAQPNLTTPFVMAGDFNAVDDHGPLRRLRAMGLTSVTDRLGAGWLPTYPANAAVPPLIPIDHVLVNGQLAATSVETLEIDNTDHLGLLVHLTRNG